ncbi:MAG: filamentous hemagglutinin N-terminal domain-containing protein, partial [Limnobacter sp.]
KVVAGQATISKQGNTLNINQSTERAAIDWQTFDVSKNSTVNFVQPSASSIALNRVLGSEVSVIQGAINANGQVFLVNQNGVLFTPTAQVNVGGIVASTQNISTEDFMAGKFSFSGSSKATVENQGKIATSNGGVVALIAAKIVNTGSISAPEGKV